MEAKIEVVKIRVQCKDSQVMATRIAEVLRKDGFEFVEFSREYDASQQGVDQTRTFLTTYVQPA